MHWRRCIIDTTSLASDRQTGSNPKTRVNPNRSPHSQNATMQVCFTLGAVDMRLKIDFDAQ